MFITLIYSTANIIPKELTVRNVKLDSMVMPHQEWRMLVKHVPVHALTTSMSYNAV